MSVASKNFDKGLRLDYTRKMSEDSEVREAGAELWVEPVGEINKLLLERKRWFRSVEVERKQERLFELEVLLKGLVVYSNLNNHPIPDRSRLIHRDFGPEIGVIRNALVRSIILIRSLLPETEAKILHFQNYVETRLMNDYQRAQLLSRAINQGTPIESLYVLCHSLIDFSELAGNLLLLEDKRYQVFYYLEQLTSREIISNHYFNPFRALGFAPHYDVIRSPQVTRVVKGIEDKKIKKLFSVMLLLLFKLLRYLSLIQAEAADLARLRDALLIIALVNSESKLLAESFEGFFPARLRESGFDRTREGKRLLELLDAFAFQLQVELKKIYDLEIRNATSILEPRPLQNSIIRTRGMLTNIFQQAIVEFCRVFDPSLDGKKLFKEFVSKLEQSLKLRRDVWLFAKVLERQGQVLDQSEAAAKLEPLYDSINTLRNFVYYYQNISFQFVRAYDREEFQKFFDYLDATPADELKNPEARSLFRKEIHGFRMFLEATLNAISHRSELEQIPFGTDEAERLLSQFLQ